MWNPMARRCLCGSARIRLPPVMNPAAGVFSLIYSLADQSFVRTKSIGILNVSLELLQALAQRPDCARLTVLANHSLREQLALPAACQICRRKAAIEVLPDVPVTAATVFGIG